MYFIVILFSVEEIPSDQYNILIIDIYANGMIPNTGTRWIRSTNLAINYYGNTNWAFDNPNFLARLLNAPRYSLSLATTSLIEDCILRACELVNIRLL